MVSRKDEGSFRFKVHSILLQKDGFRFMATVPSRLRRDKRLYRDTITQMFPRLFSIPCALRNDAEFSLAAEVKRHESLVRMLIAGEGNPLDKLVPPDAALRLLDHLMKRQARPAPPHTSKTRAHQAARLLLPQGIKEAVRARLPPPERPVDPWVFLARLLLLRLALATEQPEREPRSLRTNSATAAVDACQLLPDIANRPI